MSDSLILFIRLNPSRYTAFVKTVGGALAQRAPDDLCSRGNSIISIGGTDDLVTRTR